MLRLPRLPIGWDKISGLFQRYWDEVLTAIERTVNSLETSDKSFSLLMSFVKSSVPVITANSSGIISIQPHVRVYGTGVEVLIDGGTLSTAQPPGSVIRVYYLDDAFAGGAVTYLFSVDPDPKPAQQNGRHLVGAVAIPVSGTVTGLTIDPPGSVYL